MVVGGGQSLLKNLRITILKRSGSRTSQQLQWLPAVVDLLL